MPSNKDSSRGAGHRKQPVMGSDHDMQIERETGLPLTIEPDGESQQPKEKVAPEERLRIDPDSRIPRPVQPDLA